MTCAIANFILNTCEASQMTYANNFITYIIQSKNMQIIVF